MDSWLVGTTSQSDEGTGEDLSSDHRAGAIFELIVARTLAADSPANTRIFNILACNLRAAALACI